MDQDDPLNDYRRYLLGALSAQAAGAPREDNPGQCQVLVNHERVGSLDCSAYEPTFVFSSREQVVRQIEVRTEDGTLLGALSAPEFGFKTVHIPVGRHGIEITIHNRFQGGSATTTFRSAASRSMSERREAPSRLPADLVESPSRRLNWTSALVCAQVLLVAAVVVLGVDRLSGGRSESRAPALPPSVGNPSTAGAADVLQLEDRLSLLSRSHQAALETARTQQEELGKLRQALAALGSTHREMTAQLATAHLRAPKGRRDVHQEIETMAEMLISRADADQEQLREEIQTLAASNDKLAKQLSALEAGNHELKSRLKSAGVDVSKASSVEEQKPAVAQQSDSAGSVQVAEKPREKPNNPTLFWVTFQDGTNDQNIEQLVREIHGRRGQRRAEWTSLEVDLPDPNTQAGFLESLKKTSIVKAVAMKLDSPPIP